MEELWKVVWELQKKVAELEGEQKRLHVRQNGQRAINIRRVVYRIDSLHVRTVRGTLHIGITTPSEGSGLESVLPELANQNVGSLDHLERELLDRIDGE